MPSRRIRIAFAGELLPLLVAVCAASLLLVVVCTASPNPPDEFCMHDAIAARAGRFAPRIARTTLVRSQSTADAAVTATSKSEESSSSRPVSTGGSAKSSSTASTPVVAWQPLRIKVFSADLDNPALYCSSVNQTVTDYSSVSTLVTCTEADLLTTATRRLLLEELLPAANRLHEERLLVDPIRSIVLSYPFGDFDPICTRYTIPSSHFTSGIEDADYVVYVSATPMTGDGANTVAWAKTCQTDTDGRPVAGVLNVAPGMLSNSSFIIRTIAHELLHALGFDYNLFNSKGMLGLANLRFKVNVRGVSSNSTLAAARSHYECPSMPIMEIEDYGNTYSTSSHWKMRNAKDDLMSSYTRTVGFYTAMTIAAMEDTGFYKGNYDKAEPMAWGKGAGCTLLTNKCLISGVVQVSLTNPNTKSMFCTQPSDTLRCTSSRTAVGTCDVTNHSLPLAFYSQYFPDLYTGGSMITMDYCPLILPTPTTTCAGGDEDLLAGSVVSPASRCLSAPEGGAGVQLLGVLVPASGSGSTDGGEDESGAWSLAVRQALCVDVKCDTEASTYQVRVRGARVFVDCPEGSTISPANYSAGIFGLGELECPPYLQVCVDNTNNAFGDPELEGGDSNNNAARGRVSALTPGGLAVLVLLVLVAPLLM